MKKTLFIIFLFSSIKNSVAFDVVKGNLANSYVAFFSKEKNARNVTFFRNNPIGNIFRSPDKNSFSSSIDSLNKIRTALFKSTSDQEMVRLNDQYLRTLKQVLNNKESYKIQFDSLENIGVLMSSDNSFRLFTWNVALSDGEQKYFGFIQYIDKKKAYHLIELTDFTEANQASEYKQLDERKWIGALYYEIIPVKHKRRLYYVLLGWDGNNKSSTKKIIEVLTIQGASVRFGADVFKWEGRPKRRIIFEYSKDAVMSLKYHGDRKQIVFDHLSPVRENLTGSYQYYGPDMTYDAFELRKGKWYHIEDLYINGKTNDVYNPKSPKSDKQIYSPNK